VISEIVGMIVIPSPLSLQCMQEYGLDNLSYIGFLRITGYKSFLSASDVALAVTALLECKTKYNQNQIVDKG